MSSSYLAAFDAGPVAIVPTVHDRIQRPNYRSIVIILRVLGTEVQWYSRHCLESRSRFTLYLSILRSPSRAPGDSSAALPIFKNNNVTRFGEAVRGRERANGTNRGSQKCVSLGGEAPPEPRERQGAQACSVRSQEGCAASEDAARRRTHPRSRSLCRRFLRPRYRTRGKRLRDETSAGRGVGRLAGARRRNPSRLRRVGGVPATALFQPHERTGELSGRG